MLQRGRNEDLGSSGVSRGPLQELSTCCLPVEVNSITKSPCFDYQALTAASKLFTSSFRVPSPFGRGMNDVFPSATLMFILSKRGNLGLSLNGHPGCGGIESGSRNIMMFLIREVTPAAYVEAPSVPSRPGGLLFKGHSQLRHGQHWPSPPPGQEDTLLCGLPQKLRRLTVLP